MSGFTFSDGGLAFPALDMNGDGPGGMTLRDYFAWQVIAGIFASGKEIQSDGVKLHLSSEFAELAYNIADAMLKERDKK